MKPKQNCDLKSGFQHTETETDTLAPSSQVSTLGFNLSRYSTCALRFILCLPIRDLPGGQERNLLLEQQYTKSYYRSARANSPVTTAQSLRTIVRKYAVGTTSEK